MLAASNDDEPSALSFGALNYTAGEGPLYMEARFLLSAITDNKYFVGFGDTIASSAESSFSATTDTVTIDTMADAIGFLFDQDATTQNLWCVAGKTDAVTVNKSLAAKYNPVAATFIVLGVLLSADRKSAVWMVNGEEVYRVDGDRSTSATLIAAVALVPGVWGYEQATAFNMDVDYLYGEIGRSAT